MGTLNPYQAPTAPLDTVPVVACPKCGAGTATKVGFTWWGGAVGPRLLSVMKCSACRTNYNGKTGASLTKSIIIYQVAVMAISAVLFYFFIYAR